jgi:predicted metal-binding membrane protein
MVAFFGLGLMSVWWMTAVAALVFAEKVAPFGQRLVLPAGLALIAVGLIVIA